MDFLVAYKDQIILASSFLTLPVFVFIISLGAVYLLGRMWEVIKSYRAKNVVAFVVMIAAYVFYFSMVDVSLSLAQRVWTGAIYTGCTIIIYVLFGFKLYDRIDAFQDKRIGRDRPTKTEKPKRRA